MLNVAGNWERVGGWQLTIHQRFVQAPFDRIVCSITGSPTVAPARPIAAPPHATSSQDHAAIVAKETENLRKEYEAKLAEMKSSYEAELMSKQKLQEEMERLQNDYNRKVHTVEEQYGSTTAVTNVAPGGVGMGDVPADSAISMIALANDLVSS